MGRRPRPVTVAGTPDFGMPTLLELETLEETVALCRALGLSFIELNMNMPAYQIDRLSPEAFRPYMGEGLYFTLHLDEGLNVWDINPLVSAAYVETALAAIRFAQALGIPILNMHMHTGIYFTLPGERVYLHDRYRDAYLKRTLSFRQACEKALTGSDTLLCIENTDGFTGFQRDAIELLLKSPAFGLTLDIGHSHAAGGRDEPFMLAHRSRLRHMHVHDAIGTANHLAIGTGEMDIAARLAQATMCGCRCVLETKTARGLTASVEALRRLMPQAFRMG